MGAVAGTQAQCAILAAGLSKRMGEPKLLLQLEGEPLVRRAMAASRDFPIIVVVSRALAGSVTPAEGVTIVLNDEPERGMTHSLMLADRAASDRTIPLAVLLGDTPLVDAALVRRVVDALGDADVAYPVRGDVPGHPVVFGPRPRAAIATLPEGDTLRTLRSDARWRRVEVPIDDDRPFADVDTPEDLARLRSLMER